MIHHSNILLYLITYYHITYLPHMVYTVCAMVCISGVDVLDVVK